MARSRRYLEENGFKALLRCARERRRSNAARDRFLFLFLGRTGLRISEALAVTLDDLHLDADPPFVAVTTLKRRRRIRDEVLIDPPTAKAIRRYLRHQLQAESLDARLFNMTRRNASRLFRWYARRAGLPAGLTLHSLRHYRATYLLKRTQDLRFTQDQLRHSALASTEKYLHYTPDQVRGYLARLSARRNK